jgi:hypothetical protein
MQLYVFACELLQHRSYPDFERKLRELKAVPLMHSIWAVGTRLSAAELKRALRAVVGEYDRILVIEVRGDWASRRAENNLANLLRPRGGPALALWEQRWSHAQTSPGAPGSSSGYHPDHVRPISTLSNGAS